MTECKPTNDLFHLLTLAEPGIFFSLRQLLTVQCLSNHFGFIIVFVFLWGILKVSRDLAANCIVVCKLSNHKQFIEDPSYISVHAVMEDKQLFSVLLHCVVQGRRKCL